MDPSYVLRRNRTCRAPRLRASARDGIVLTVPSRFPARLVPVIFHEHREWADSALLHIETERARIADELAVFPREIDLALTGRRLALVQAEEPGSSRCQERAGVLAVPGAAHDGRYAALRAWLQRHARAVLPELLAEQSRCIGLPYARVAVRGQRTRWGSCSRSGTVSLNRALLLIDERLVHYVLVHELMHTVHFDHSAAFWRAMEAEIPDPKGLALELRAAWATLPAWVRLS